MNSPKRIDCRFFYGDYYRGREIEECRLIGKQPPPHHWTIDLCRKCPVPRILRANACENMILKASVKPVFLNFGRRVVVSSYCTKTKTDVAEPEIGCGECHPMPSIFFPDQKTK
jgi:hypothetical protein